jgi:ribosomal protein S18 acetylase RimI-like enzyme
MDQFIIRRAFPEDLETVRSIGTETFMETFAENNSAKDMEQYVAKNFNIEKVSAEINNPDSLFFIAWDAGIPVGYLKVNSGKSQTDLQDDAALEIERIYVKAAYHGKKVGQLLYDQALEIAKLKGKSYIWLGVWEENPKAIRFYEKNGFVAFDKHLFRLGEDEQTDILMKKML